MRGRHQRLTLVAVALAAVVAAALLAMSAPKDQAAFFSPPGDLARADIALGIAIRLGGMVARGSVRKRADGVPTTFTVTDNAATTPVTYRGIVPDLFREGAGVVTEGAFAAHSLFVATNILARHDERYLPPQMAGKMHTTGTLAK